MNPYIKSLEFMDIMSGSEEKTPTVSPDQGATGETTPSSENKEAHNKEEYNNAVHELLENIHRQNPELGWDIIIESLFKHFARENRAKRSKEEIFLELDRLEALETEHLETSGSVPDALKRQMKLARGWEEFETYVTLLKEVRTCFGCEAACIIISYIDKHKGERYCMNCMRHCDIPPV